MFNFGMGGYDPMMSQMGMMGMMGGMGMPGMNTGGNVYQSFKAKYGCEDCFNSSIKFLIKKLKSSNCDALSPP